MDKEIKLKYVIAIMFGVITLTVVILVFGIYGRLPGTKSLKLSVGQAELQVNVDNDALYVSKTMNSLLKEENTSNEIKGILNGNGYYHFSDEGLSLKLEKLQANDSLAQKIVLMIRSPTSFFKDLPPFYQLTDSNLLADIKKIKANHPLAVGLREMAQNNAPPFIKDSQLGYVSFPGSIPDGHAAVCGDTVYKNRDLVIYTDPPSYRMIFVKADMRLPCQASVVGYDVMGREMNLIQISHNMGRLLFECQPFNKTMKVNVEILTPGDETNYPKETKTIQCVQEGI